VSCSPCAKGGGHKKNRRLTGFFMVSIQNDSVETLVGAKGRPYTARKSLYYLGSQVDSASNMPKDMPKESRLRNTGALPRLRPVRNPLFDFRP
jgi:hypothetical protein